MTRDELQNFAREYLAVLQAFAAAHGLEAPLTRIDHLAIKANNSAEYETLLRDLLPLSNSASYTEMNNRRLASLALAAPIDFGPLGSAVLLEVLEPKPEKQNRAPKGLDHIEIIHGDLEALALTLSDKKIPFQQAQNSSHRALVIILNEGAASGNAPQEIKFTDIGLEQMQRIESEQGKTIFLKPKKRVTTLALIHQDGKVLLGMKKRGFGTGKWNGFGGKIQPGETIAQALDRETLEEAGITIEQTEKVGVLSFVGVIEEVIETHIFRVTKYSGQPGESEEMKPRWFAEADIPFDEMWPDDRYWFPKFLRGEPVYATFRFLDPDTVVEQIWHSPPA